MTNIDLTNSSQAILNFILIGGSVFAVYLYFRKPQERTETKEALMSKEFQGLTEKFTSLTKDFVNLRDNHIHTLVVKIDAAITSINGQAVEIAKLSTIIDERIPRKIN